MRERLNPKTNPNLTTPLIFLILLLQCSVSFAACRFDSSPIHRVCEYYAQSWAEAYSLCEQKADDLVAEGYRELGCGGVEPSAFSGWYTTDQAFNTKYPFQFILVYSNAYCDGELSSETGVCSFADNPSKNHGCSHENGVGNPCNVATGNKFQSEIDTDGALAFTRYYNSQNLVDLGLGKGWRSNFHKKLIVSQNSLVQVSESGRGELWTKVNGEWQGDSGSSLSILESADGFQVLRNNGTVEKYSFNGKLLTNTDNNGNETNFTYDDFGQLIQLTDHTGQSIQLDHIDRRLNRVISVTGEEYRYEYDSMGNLESIIYPDETPSDLLDNPRRTYHYENPDFPHHLTGISDENGVRFATYVYDSEGKAISTEHAQTTNAVSQEQFELDYQEAN